MSQRGANHDLLRKITNLTFTYVLNIEPEIKMVTYLYAPRSSCLSLSKSSAGFKGINLYLITLIGHAIFKKKKKNSFSASRGSKFEITTDISDHAIQGESQTKMGRNSTNFDEKVIVPYVVLVVINLKF